MIWTDTLSFAKKWCLFWVFIAECLLGRRVMALSASLKVRAIDWTCTNIFLDILWCGSKHSSQKEWSVGPAPILNLLSGDEVVFPVPSDQRPCCSTYTNHIIGRDFIMIGWHWLKHDWLRMETSIIWVRHYRVKLSVKSRYSEPSI